jgi:hypothetical protein
MQYLNCYLRGGLGLHAWKVVVWGQLIYDSNDALIFDCHLSLRDMRWSIEEALRWDVLRIHKWSAINFFLRYHKRVKLSPRIPRIVSLISGFHNNRIFLFTLLILRTLVLPEKVWWKFNGTIIPGWNLDYFIKFWCLLWYRHVLIYVWTSSHK